MQSSSLEAAASVRVQMQQMYEFKCNKVMFGELYGEALLPLRCINNRIHMKLQCQRPRSGITIPETYNLSVGHNDVQQILVYFGHVPSLVAIETSQRFAEVACRRIGGDILVPSSSEPKKKYIILALESAFKLDTEANVEISQLMACLKPWAKVKILTLEAAQKLIMEAELNVCQKELCYNKTSKPSGLVETILVYQPIWATGDVPLTLDDMMCLAEGKNLNDVIINFYLKYVYDNILTPGQRIKTHIFNTYFYKRLMKKQSKKFSIHQMHNAVRRWTDNVNIFEKDFIVIPVNENDHWYMIVVCFPSMAFSNEEGEVLSDKKDPRKEEESADFVKEIGTDKSLDELAGVSTSSDNVDMEDVNSENVIPDPNMPSPSIEDQLDFIAQCSYPPSTMTKNGGGGSGGDSSCTSLGGSGKEVIGCGRKQAFHGEEVFQPCILIFDSSPGSYHSQVFTNMRHYLTQEWAVRRPDQAPREYDKTNMKGCYPKVPHSINDYDSGVFLLQYVESFFTHSIKNFVIPIQLQSWFTLELVFKKRKHISDLINDLAACVGRGKRRYNGEETIGMKRSRMLTDV